MENKYLENLINKFEQSLSETERMSNALIELNDVFILHYSSLCCLLLF